MKAPALTIVILFFIAYVLILAWLILASLVKRWKKKEYETRMKKLRTKIKVLRVNDSNAATILYLFNEIKKECDMNPGETNRMYYEFLVKYKTVIHERIINGIDI